MKKLYIVLALCCMNIAAFPQTTFYYTGAVQTYTVPSGVTSISVDMQGGSGGAGYSSGTGGAGGRVLANLAVAAGTTVYVYVGGAGSMYGFSTGIAGGGGMTGGAGGYYTGGGGGGSDIRIGGTGLANRMIVAGGGGGGGGGYDCSFEYGGAGGGLTGGHGIYCSSASITYAGQGGTQAAGGAGATTSTGGNGSLGMGGNGEYYYYGGAGGGGYYGGGGGYYGSGGGGSSYTDFLATGVIHTQGYNTTGNGIIVIATSSCPIAITGSSSVCAGSSTTIADSITGGIWSASNSHATVDTSGFVAGLTAGVDTIYYSGTSTCGSFMSMHIITVNSIPAIGIISGPDTVLVGSSITLTDSVVGGTWSSADTLFATVSSSGVVTGIGESTTAISYSIVTGCGTAYTISMITILPDNIISGHVMFDSGAYIGPLKVWLIAFDTATLLLEAIDSTVVYCSGTSVYYQFTGVPTDSVRVKAAVPDTGSATTGYIASYHNSSFYWHDANVIWHTSGTPDTDKNIYMAYGAITAWPGFISGSVLAGADKGTSGGTPVVGLRMVLINAASGAVMQQTHTNAAGNYSFGGLPLGAAYTVFPDSLNYLTTPFIGVNLTTGADTMLGANFKQHTLSKTITPIPTGIYNVLAKGASIVLSPNPASTKLNIHWEVTGTEKTIVTLYDITGREVFSTPLIMTLGAGMARLELPALTSGLYLVNIKSPGINYNSKLQVGE